MTTVCFQISGAEDTFWYDYEMQPGLKAYIHWGSIINSVISWQNCQNSHVKGLHTTEVSSICCCLQH